MLTKHQQDVIDNFDAHAVAEIFEHMGWSWAYLQRAPDPLEIRHRLKQLLEEAELQAHRCKEKVTTVATGRLSVTADVSQEPPFFTVQFIAIDSDSSELASYYEAGGT